MKRRWLGWFLLGCCLAALATFVAGRRTDWRPRQQTGAGTSAQKQGEATVRDKTSEVPVAKATEPRDIRAGQEAVLARPGETRASRPEGVWAELVGRDDPARPPAQGAGQRESSSISNEDPARKAEVWSYGPLLQTNAVNIRSSAMERLKNAKSEFERYLLLNTAAKSVLVFGETEEARRYATELLSLYQKFKAEPWSAWSAEGVAVHDGNFVLGRIAVQEGQIDEAKRYLLEAGKSTGSPVLNTFGPNMSLARDLLLNGERETVLQYFELCGKFWSNGTERLALWTEDVKAGRMPDFGANRFL